jgi:hypothetical protein
MTLNGMAIARAWRASTAALSLSLVVLGLLSVGSASTHLPGLASDVFLIAFAPLALTACVGGMWRSQYPCMEETGVWPPCVLRGGRAALSIVLALLGAGVLLLADPVPQSTIFLTSVCLASGLFSSLAASTLWWVIPLCVNYFYYAARLNFGESAIAAPAGVFMVCIAATAYAAAPAHVRVSS